MARRHEPALLGLIALLGCGGDLSSTEAEEAVTEAIASTVPEAITAALVEAGAQFTLGQAQEDAAVELAAAWSAAEPCVTAYARGRVVRASYSGCDFLEQGVDIVTIERADAGDAEVTHAWSFLSRGVVHVDGVATVTWADATRHVEHELFWTSEGETWSATGSRTQLASDDAFLLDGTRDWSHDGDDWHADLDAARLRPEDPLPEEGAYGLTAPNRERAELTFERIDEETIRVTVAGKRRTRAYEVSASD